VTSRRRDRRDVHGRVLCLQYDHESDGADGAGGLVPRRGSPRTRWLLRHRGHDPDLRKLPSLAERRAVPRDATEWVAFDIYDIATQMMSSNYVEVIDGRGECRSTPFRHGWPTDLDLMAQLAGPRLRERWDGRDGWDGNPSRARAASISRAGTSPRASDDASLALLGLGLDRVAVATPGRMFMVTRLRVRRPTESLRPRPLPRRGRSAKRREGFPFVLPICALQMVWSEPSELLEQRQKPI
jgi:hypothetical protein